MVDSEKIEKVKKLLGNDGNIIEVFYEYDELVIEPKEKHSMYYNGDEKCVLGVINCDDYDDSKVFKAIRSVFPMVKRVFAFGKRYTNSSFYRKNGATLLGHGNGAHEVFDVDCGFLIKIDKDFDLEVFNVGESVYNGVNCYVAEHVGEPEEEPLFTHQDIPELLEFLWDEYERKCENGEIVENKVDVHESDEFDFTDLGYFMYNIERSFPIIARFAINDVLSKTDGLDREDVMFEIRKRFIEVIKTIVQEPIQRKPFSVYTVDEEELLEELEEDED